MYAIPPVSHDVRSDLLPEQDPSSSVKPTKQAKPLIEEVAKTRLYLAQLGFDFKTNSLPLEDKEQEPESLPQAATILEEVKSDDKQQHETEHETIQSSSPPSPQPPMEDDKAAASLALPQPEAIQPTIEEEDDTEETLRILREHISSIREEEKSEPEGVPSGSPMSQEDKPSPVVALSPGRSMRILILLMIVVTKSRPASEYQQALSALEQQFGVALSLFEELRTDGVTSPEQRSLLEQFTSCFSGMNQRLVSTLDSVVPSRSLMDTSSLNTTTASMSFTMPLPQIGSSLNSTSNSVLSATFDFSKAIERYSLMLVEACKERKPKENQ